MTIHGPATYTEIVGYEEKGESIWGTDSLPQFSDDELRIVVEYNETGKIEEGFHDKPR